MQHLSSTRSAWAGQRGEAMSGSSEGVKCIMTKGALAGFGFVATGFGGTSFTGESVRTVSSVVVADTCGLGVCGAYACGCLCATGAEMMAGASAGVDAGVDAGPSLPHSTIKNIVNTKAAKMRYKV